MRPEAKAAAATAAGALGQPHQLYLATAVWGHTGPGAGQAVSPAGSGPHHNAANTAAGAAAAWRALLAIQRTAWRGQALAGWR